MGRKRFDAVIDTPVGRLGLVMSAGRVTQIEFVTLRQALQAPGTAAARHTVKALRSYFRSAKAPLDIEVEFAGTEFQRRVWAALRAIPVGEVRTYGALARQLGSSPRAVGGACRSNPVPIIVPCHRVVAQNGPGGFGGKTSGPRLEIKKRLLRHEGIEFSA
jgi:methylated-DNA-[protein]-cysteine S-methyltransferase